jgi:hypothetical protein
VSSNRTICLNMIVKDEERIIRRYLEAIRPFIDYWAIEDTWAGDCSYRRQPPPSEL